MTQPTNIDLWYDGIKQQVQKNIILQTAEEALYLKMKTFKYT
jgi:hypothetical protein